MDLDSLAPNLAASYHAAAELVATMKAANGVKKVDLIAGKQHNDSTTAGSIALASGIAAPRAAARLSRIPTASEALVRFLATSRIYLLSRALGEANDVA